MINGRKKKPGKKHDVLQWYNPSDWGFKPSDEVKITIRMIPIVAVLILGFSLGLTSSGQSANVAKGVFKDLGGDYKSQLEEAYSSVISGDFTTGVAIANGVLLEDPENALAYNILGLAHARRGLTEEAAISFQTAVEFDPGFSLAWYNLGVVEERRGEFELAFQAYQQAVEIDPDRQNYMDSARRLDRIIHGEGGWEILEGEDERLFLEGVNAVNRGGSSDLSYAENIFRSLLSDRPYDVASRNMLGLTLARQGKLYDAEQFFIQVVEAEPGYADAWYNLGMLHREQGRLEEALNDFLVACSSSSLDSFRETASRMADDIREILDSEVNITSPDGTH